MKTINKRMKRVANESRTFTPAQVYKSLVRALSPSLAATGGLVETFAERGLNGSGLVITLSSGQEYRLLLVPMMAGRPRQPNARSTSHA